jgi:hypothetical protein
MIGLPKSLCWTVLIAAVLPATAAAETIQLYNKSGGPLEIQTASVIQGAVRRGPTIRLEADKTHPPFQLPGNKIITVYDPRVPNRPLYMGTIPGSPLDLKLDIVPDVPPPRVKLESHR